MGKCMSVVCKKRAPKKPKLQENPEIPITYQFGPQLQTTSSVLDLNQVKLQIFKKFPQLKGLEIQLKSQSRKIQCTQDLVYSYQQSRPLKIQIIQQTDWKFQLDDILQPVAGNMVLLRKNNKPISSGFIFKGHILTTKIHPQQACSVRQAHSSQITHLHTDQLSLMPLENLVLAKNQIEFFSTIAIGNPPQVGDKLNVLFFSVQKPILQYEVLAIIREENGHWVLSKNLPKGSTGGAIFDDLGQLVGVVIKENEAISVKNLNGLSSEFLLESKSSKRSEKITYTDFSMNESIAGEFPKVIQEPTIKSQVQPEAKQFIGLPQPEPLQINFLQFGYCISLYHSEMLFYNPDQYQVRKSDTPIVAPGYSLTQTPEGLFIVCQRNCLYWEGNQMKEIQAPKQYYINHAAVYHQGKVVVIGGKDHNKTEALDTFSFQWENYPQIPAKIQQAAAISYNEQLFLMGGIENTGVSSNIYLLENFWIKLGISLPQRLAGFGVFTMYDTFYILGGYGIRAYNRKAWKMNLTGEVSLIDEIPFDGVYFGLQFGMMDNEFVSFSRNGRILKFDANIDRFFLVSLGNYNHIEVNQENYLQTSFFL